MYNGVNPFVPRDLPLVTCWRCRQQVDISVHDAVSETMRNTGLRSYQGGTVLRYRCRPCWSEIRAPFLAREDVRAEVARLHAYYERFTEEFGAFDQVLKEIPDVPGIYEISATMSDGSIWGYIGQARSLPARLSQHLDSMCVERLGPPGLDRLLQLIHRHGKMGFTAHWKRPFDSMRGCRDTLIVCADALPEFEWFQRHAPSETARSSNRAWKRVLHAVPKLDLRLRVLEYDPIDLDTAEARRQHGHENLPEYRPLWVNDTSRFLSGKS